MVNKYMKRCLLSLDIREMQIKIIRYYFAPTRMAIIENQTIKSIGKNVNKIKLSFIAGKNVNLYSHFEKQCGNFLKLNINLPYNPVSSQEK